MDMTQIDEKWLEIPKARRTRGKKSLVSISNTGRYKRADGTLGILELRHSVRSYGVLKRCSRIIAENFLITVRRPDQVFVDHITHNPTEYNVNDVRNLRWCTKKENSNFEEARENISKSLKGLFEGEKNPRYGKGYQFEGDKNPNWKGDDVCIPHAYMRALKLYKDGKISEEEFQPYRDKLQDFRRQRKMATKTSSDS